MKTPEEHRLPIEVVGLPGAGKTALVERLSTFVGGIDNRVRAGRILAFRASGLALAPLVMKRLTTSSGSWAEARRVLRLEASLSVLDDRDSNRARPLILDQGPVYLLHRLDAEGLGGSSVAAAAAWHEGMLQRCARSLGTVIALDAPNEVLIERIRERSKGHRLKQEPHEAARTALTDQRERLHRLLDQLQAKGLPTVVWIDTSEVSLPQATVKALEVLGLQPPIKDGKGRSAAS